MKNARHQQILELIRREKIETQEELADRLRETGFQVTQATVSRDIRQLQLVKNADEDGHQRYTVSEQTGTGLSERYRNVLTSAFVSVDFSGNIAVIKTVSGMAMAAAAALDSMDWEELLGCIAGDDTIMCVMRNEGDAASLRRKLLSAAVKE